MASDQRRDYLTKSAVEALGASTPSGMWAASPEEMYGMVHGSPAMQEFLERADVRTLQVSTMPNASGATELMVTTSIGLSGQRFRISSQTMRSCISAKRLPTQR